jgi:hypothetical protein
MKAFAGGRYKVADNLALSRAPLHDDLFAAARANPDFIG